MDRTILMGNVETSTGNHTATHTHQTASLLGTYSKETHGQVPKSRILKDHCLD